MQGDAYCRKLFVFMLLIAALSINIRGFYAAVTAADSPRLYKSQADFGQGSSSGAEEGRARAAKATFYTENMGPTFSFSPEPLSFILEDLGSEVACREPSAQEAQSVGQRDQRLPLHLLYPIRLTPAGAGGLRILLRGTDQLEGFPQAKRALLDAARTWEAAIQSPVTITIDVDFGPSRFGIEVRRESLVGFVSAQGLTSSSIYPQVRSSLLAGASSEEEALLYSALPERTIPTDIGDLSAITAPAPLFRALGLINPVASADAEMSRYGDSPSIWFNSDFSYDFDPSDGIDTDKLDFQAIVIHGIGHVLGFCSYDKGVAGASSATSTTILDLVRAHPGSTLSSFGADHRIGSMGVMEGAFRPGEKKTITNNDLRAIDLIGYRLKINATQSTVPLTSGVPRSGSIPATDPNACLIGDPQYTIQVPLGTTQLRVTLSGNQTDALLIRFGQPVTLASGQPVADFISDNIASSHTITVTPSSSPALRQGMYFIAVANCSTSLLNFTLTATVSTGGPPPPPGGGNSAPSIRALAADLRGDLLTLTGTATDPDGDMSQTQVAVFNGAGTLVAETDPIAVDFGASTTSDFELQIAGLNDVPDAVIARLIILDRRGNRSASAKADFSKPDPSGPTILNGSFSGTKLTIKGRGFVGELQVEINGEVVATGFDGSDKKIKIKGSQGALNLHGGPNRVRVHNGRLRSNLFVLDL